MFFVNNDSPGMYDVEIEHRLQEISKQIEEERTRNYEYTENDRINQLGFNQAKIINDNAIVRQVFDLRTPEYTLVMPSDICAPKYASTGAVTSQQKQVTSNLSNWKQRLSITLALFLLLRFRGMLFATESFIETPTANLVDYADILFATSNNMSHAQVLLQQDSRSAVLAKSIYYATGGASE
jgi:hypothetical protein